jgi:DUF1016 N-terminal domain
MLLYGEPGKEAQFLQRSVSQGWTGGPAFASAPGYAKLLKEIKDRIERSRTRAIFSVNAELIRLYWDIGQMIDDRQREEGWGTAVIPRLARELHNELPEEKGYSERNIKRMLAFYRAYRDPNSIVPQPVAQLTGTAKVPRAVAQTGALRDRQADRGVELRADPCFAGEPSVGAADGRTDRSRARRAWAGICSRTNCGGERPWPASRHKATKGGR